MVVRKVGTTIKDSVFQLFLDLLSQFHLLTECKVNQTNYTITLPNGSVILFKGLDDREKIKSITGITDVWTEEATELTQEDYQQLDLRLRARAADLQYFLSFNPVSKANWCFKYWFAGEPQPNTLVLKTTYKDNRFLPPEYVATLENMKRTNYIYWQIYANGEFCSLDKLVLTYWRQATEGEQPPKGLPLLVGLDFGYTNDPSALVVSYLDEANKKIYIVDEYYEKGKLNSELAQTITYKGYAKEVIIADSAEQKSIEEIKRAGIPRIKAATKGQGSVLQGIQKLQQYELIVSSKCANTIVELQNFAWKKDKASGEYVNEPADDYNHCIDALRYSLQCVENKQRIQTMSKTALGL